VLAVELLCAAQALDFRQPVAPSPATAPLWQGIRAAVPTLAEDRYLAPEIARMQGLIASGALLPMIPAL
jgi:histidine ammonia-lyase